MPLARRRTPSDRAKNGGSTVIWVACARIAASLRPNQALASISVVTSPDSGVAVA